MLAWFWGFVFIGVVVLVAIGGMLLVRRSVTPSLLENHNEVAGFIYAVIGVAYAVLLAFVVVAVWERFEYAQMTVEQEANELGDLFRNAQAFPEEVKEQLRAQIRGYAEAVLREEWPAMARGEASPAAWETFNQLWQGYVEVEPQNAYEELWYAESLDRLDELGDYRRLRLLSSRASVPGILWAVLVIGGAITIAFSYLFGAKNVFAQALMVAALAGTLALSLFLILALDHPFRGVTHVGTEAFEQLLDIFDYWAQVPVR